MEIYRELIESLGIKKGDKVWLSSELLKLVLICKKIKIEFNASKLLDYFQEAVGKDGTLLLPTFCFEFSNNKRYDYVYSKGITGALGNVALARKDFVRTQHPMHSFAVWGKDQELLCAMNNKHAFGIDSPFEYCRVNNVKQIMLGTDYVHAMTFVHYAENMCGVPYRFAKRFTGIYVTRGGKEEERSYDYAARRLDVGTIEKFNRIGLILEEKGIAESSNYKGYISHIVHLGDSYHIICNDILHNQCRNIYDFGVPREELFAGFGGK